MSGIGLQSFIPVLVVLALVVGLAWIARRGGFGPRGRGGRPVSIESAVSLGDRRSLVVVAVEERRLLLGVTASQISVVTELKPPATFAQQLEQRQP